MEFLIPAKKAALDRLFGVFECREGYAIPPKECGLLMVAQESYADNWVLFDNWYALWLKNMGWKDIGSIRTGGFLKPGEIAGNKVLESAFEFGASTS